MRLVVAVAARTVSAKGDRVKVAVIASRQDLGAVPSLFGHPQQYAAFLATEIAFAYRGPLLVVMPAGLGVAGARAHRRRDATFLVPMREARQGAWYSVTWRAPRRGTFSVCAAATDPAGNRGTPRCGKLTVA